MPGQEGAKYLPGMEGDPSGAILENWTDADWGDWFRGDVQESQLWLEINEYWSMSSSQKSGQKPRWREDSDLADAADVLESNADEMWSFTSDLHEAKPDEAFERLSLESKIKFFNGFNRVGPSYDYRGYRPEGEPTPHPRKRPKWMIPVFAAAALAVVFFVATNLGSGEDQPDGAGPASNDWFVIDEENDFEATWDDFDPIEDPNTAGDITGMDVGVDGETTSVSIQFRGAAQSINGTRGEALDADLLITLTDGRIINVIWGAEKCKISDPPAGWSVECEWVTTGELQFRIRGLEVEPGTKFSFGTIQEFQGTFSSDTVELVTD